jgi:hypothetical protein
MGTPHTYLLGPDAKMYYGEPGTELAEMEELDRIRNVRVTSEKGESDATFRSNQGVKGVVPVLLSLGYEFEMAWDEADEAFLAFEAAFQASTGIELAVLDRDKALVGARGPKATFSVIKFAPTQDDENIQVAEISVKVREFDEWYENEGT